MLVDNERQYIHSHDHILYVPGRDCNTKFNINLLYSTRPKNSSKNYSVHVDTLDKNTLTHHASWNLPILFSFLPVNRLATILIIPNTAFSHCLERCGDHGKCIPYVNGGYFCRCDPTWTGSFCNISTHACDCSSDSLCIDSSICVCPLGKFGPRCYLRRSSCRPINGVDICNNNGICIPSDERISEVNFYCICKVGYVGAKCTQLATQIEISFKDISIPQAILAHFIQVFGDRPHEGTTTFRKILDDRDFVVLEISFSFNILITEISPRIYYLSFIQDVPATTGQNISIQLNSSQQCLWSNELFNSTMLGYSLLRRMKSYHLLCQEKPKLACFYDTIHTCLCNDERQANCLEFDHNITYNCRGQRDLCENGA